MPALAVRSLLVAVACLLAPAVARAQRPFVAPAAAPAPPPPPPAPPPPPVLAEPAPPAPAVVAPPAPAAQTDHDLIVGRWGVGIRQFGANGVFNRTPGNDQSCSPNCPIVLNALEVRQWRNPHYAWNAGLAFSTGGGSRFNGDTMSVQTWDVYLGVGPTLGANFLLHDWNHFTVSFSPQVDAIFFIPRSTGPKTFLFNARGLLEGELQMGFIGLPALSVGTSAGLVASLRTVSRSSMTATGTASQWSVGFSEPTTLWGLVTNLYLRFYF